MRSFFNKIKNMDKRYRNALCALFLAVAVIVAGVMLAYFTSRDEVTNRLSGHSYLMEIVLTEPKWSATGSADAQETVPGMEIDKDPYVTNLLSENAYIRMKIEFLVYNDKEGEYVTVSKDENETLTLFNYYGETTETTSAGESSQGSTTTEATTQSQITDEQGNSGWLYSRLLSTVYYNISENAHKHLVTIGESSNTIANSNNPYFKYEDGWFYYLDYENEDTAKKSNLKKMAYKEKTFKPLFTDIKLPVFKDEYNDLFANGFKIKVTVQAVNANEFKNSDDEEYIPDTSKDNDMEGIKNVFEEKFSPNADSSDSENK